MRKNLIRVLTAFILVFLLLALAAAPALAFDSRTGTNVTVASGEVVNGDLYVTGANITINGTVNGDVFGAGQAIIINGTINGGITLAAQTITVNGTVSTGARIAGQVVTVGGKIGRDLLAAGQDVNVRKTATIGGDLNSYSDNFTVDGHVSGNVTGSVNNMTISGRVDKNVIVTVNELTLTSTASIGGNLTYTSDNKVNIQSGATVAGTTNQILPAATQPAQSILAGILAVIFFKVYGYVAIFIIGIILIFAVTRPIKRFALSIRDYPLPCLGWGALIFFATPIAALIVMVTLIGIPISLIALAIWGILLYLSQIPVALIVGWLILARGREAVTRGFLVGALVLGLLIIYLISLIPVFGWIFWLFVMIFGLGSLVPFFRRRPVKTIVEPIV